jgi:hypothetical protein
MRVGLDARVQSRWGRSGGVPLGEALLTMGHVSFWGKGTEVFADGRLTPI